MKKTFKDLQEIDGIVNGLYKKNEVLRETKFGYAYKRFYEKNFVTAAKTFNEGLQTLHVDYALEDAKTKEVLLDATSPRGFKYSREGLKNLIAMERTYQDEFATKELDIEPFISPFIPAELTPSECEILKDVLI